MNSRLENQQYGGGKLGYDAECYSSPIFVPQQCSTSVNGWSCSFLSVTD